MPRHLYLIALGSNQRHHRHGRPEAVLTAALAWLDRGRVRLVASSPVIASAPVGPSQRRYANAAAIVRTRLGPPRLLRRLQRIETRFGRCRSGQPWRARVLDLDIVLWSGGAFAHDDLVIPHPQFRRRAFVLQPAKRIAAAWRDPLTALTIAHLTSRLTRPRRTPRASAPARSHAAARALSSVGRATDF